MRVSITDRCNLRCRYCMPEDQPFIEHDQILRYEEIIRICRAATKLGVRNIKIAGGEPLVRRGCCELIEQIKALPGIEHVTVTTNGVLLEEVVPRFREIGVDGVNISLDTLRPDVYAKITGRDSLTLYGAGCARLSTPGCASRSTAYRFPASTRTSCAAWPCLRATGRLTCALLK